MHLSRLARRGDRDLALEVEMLLPANLERAAQAVRRGGKRGIGGIAARHALGGLDQRLGGIGIGDADATRERLQIEHRLARGPARGLGLVAATRNRAWPG
jgi:hypothetical protein